MTLSALLFGVTAILCAIAAGYSLHYARLSQYRHWLRLAGAADLSYMAVVHAMSFLMLVGVIPPGPLLRSGILTVSGALILVALYIAEIITCKRG